MRLSRTRERRLQPSKLDSQVPVTIPRTELVIATSAGAAGLPTTGTAAHFLWPDHRPLTVVVPYDRRVSSPWGLPVLRRIFGHRGSSCSCVRVFFSSFLSLLPCGLLALFTRRMLMKPWP